MNKIVCDVCGTSYHESVNQCPICGCVRSADAKVVPVADDEEQQATSSGTYTYVKGGRFSKSNVKRRTPAVSSETDEEYEEEVQNKKADRGLLVAFIVLLVSVAAVICYILVKFLSPELLDPNSNKKPGTGNVNNEPVATTKMEEEWIGCEEITVAQDNILLSAENETISIEFTLEPADTMDEVTFTSSDEKVVTVSADGVITAIGSGEATIVIACGDIEKTITVTCDIPTTEPTLPSVPSVDLPSVAPGFELNRSDFTLFKKGETWTLYSGNISASEITWKSSNPKVATVTNGKVTAVSAGKTVITAEYQGTKLTCNVYCKDSVGEYVDPDQGSTDDSQQTPRYKLNKTDITIEIDESCTLKLTDENGNVVDATFTTSNAGVCSVSGSTVTGVDAGKANITATYDGQSFVCIVRVKDMFE